MLIRSDRNAVYSVLPHYYGISVYPAAHHRTPALSAHGYVHEPGQQSMFSSRKAIITPNTGAYALASHY